MTKAEAKRILRDIEIASSKDLDDAISHVRSSSRSSKRTGTLVGAGAGALAGALHNGTPLQKALRIALGGLAGGGIGLGIGAIAGKGDRNRVYSEVKRRREEQISDLLGQLNESASYDLQREIANKGLGIQSKGTDYGVFVGGKGTYSSDDKLIMKKDEEGRPLLSLLFAGINSSVENDGKSSAKSPFAERFYNKSSDRFSDVQANSVWDDPVVADAYMDKIVSKIMANRAKTGKYPRVRLVGYSAGGRGVVNFLKKMRERDPSFRVDEIIGIDPYQFPWEGIPSSLRDPINPVANRIVYSRLADNYTGSSQKGIGRIGDAVSNTFVSLLGKKLRGLSANTVVENHIPGISHTDADTMYESALQILAELRAADKKQNQKNQNKEKK